MLNDPRIKLIYSNSHKSYAIQLFIQNIAKVLYAICTYSNLIYKTNVKKMKYMPREKNEELDRILYFI